ncbi:MAG TPA: F0F1 ATP synthase subunit delta [Candidatus Saccharibacteria bacterium]|nr:F0F1 ATP synthase subunit delta [Candidatus Saccharibacteria bacterium]HRQ06784.1 F0F1 ATP synthase subunit delta [Candidatus Saccharibacteria bacterium]
MAIRISRRKLADYFADEFVAGKKDIHLRLAAYLIDTKRTRELAIIVRDIEYNLAMRGQVIADVMSAHELTTATRKQIEALVHTIKPKASVYFRTAVDPTVIGGVKVEALEQVMDSTVKNKLTMLKANKV